MYQLTIVGCVLGGFGGGLFAAQAVRRRALLTGLAVGTVLFLLLLTIGALFFETMELEAGGIGLLCGGLCGGAAAGLLNGGRRKAVPEKTQKTIEIHLSLCYNSSKPLLWEGNRNEAC